MGRQAAKRQTVSDSDHSLDVAESIFGLQIKPTPAPTPIAAHTDLASKKTSLGLSTPRSADSPASAFEALGLAFWRLDLRSGRAHLRDESIPLFQHVFGIDHHCLEEGRFGFVAHTHIDDRDRVLAVLAAEIQAPVTVQFRIVDQAGAERWIKLKVARAIGSADSGDWLWLCAENVTAETIEGERQKRLLADRILSSLFGSNLSRLNPAELSSTAIMTKVAAKWKTQIETQGLRWIGPDSAPQGPGSILDASEDLLVIMTDSMFENALEFALVAGASDPWVRFEFFEDDQSVYFAISDCGHGVPLTMRGQIFEPFFSTKPESATGLGLTLARSAAEWHGGTLRLDHFSKNTRFVAQIPKRFRKKS